MHLLGEAGFRFSVHYVMVTQVKLVSDATPCYKIWSMMGLTSLCGGSKSTYACRPNSLFRKDPMSPMLGLLGMLSQPMCKSPSKVAGSLLRSKMSHNLQHTGHVAYEAKAQVHVTRQVQYMGCRGEDL